MNTQASESDVSKQYDFAKDDLTAATSNPDIKWIVVFFHKPMYTSRSEHEPEADLQENFHQLFDRYGVDLVLYGHNHNYQRTFPLKYNPADPSSPIIETTEKTNYKDPAGEVYVNVGTGGESHFRPARLVSAGAARQTRKPRQKFLCVERHDGEIQRRADHLQRL